MNSAPGPADSPETLPAAFVQRCERLGAALDFSVLERLGIPRKTVFRVNRLRSDAEQVVAELLSIGLEPTAVEGLTDAFAVAPDQRDALTRAAPALDGRIYFQGASSQRGASLLGAHPGERVLDLAAAPGGKTLQIAAEMQDSGEIVAVEVVRDRFFRLRENLERAGVHCVQTVCMDGRRVPRAWHQSFDRVLLDAPCSSEARFVPGEPATFERWSIKKVRDMATKQWGLLGSAIRCLRPGGTLVYSTCSFAPEENEATVAAHLGPDVELLEAALGPGVETRGGLVEWARKRWPEELRRAQRIVPDALHEGFFVALLTRR